MLGLHLDRQREGKHYEDRLHRILGTFHAMGVLWTEEAVSNRDGSTYKHRVELIRPSLGGDGKRVVLVTPNYEKYALAVNPRVLSRVRGMAPQIAYSLNVPSVAIEVDGDTVYVRVPRECSVDAGTILFEQAWALAPDIRAGDLLLGVDEEENQLIINMENANNVHVAVIGMTGSGKSTLMKSMILSAEMTGARVALFDPSGGFHSLSGHPAVWRGGMFRRAEDCERGLAVLAHKLERDNEGASLMFVFVDEVPELVRQRPQIREHLGRLAQAGRHAGLHLILGAQHPLVSELGSATLRNVPVRLVGRVTDRGAAYNAAGQADSGAEHLRGSGDFLAFTGSTKRHFQAAIPSPELLNSWAHRYPPHLPRVPAKPVDAGPRPVLVQSAPSEDGGGGGGGRGPEEIEDTVIAAIRERIREHGSVSGYWVRQLTKLPEYGGEEFRHERAMHAIEIAQEA